jgi:TonB family protein
MAKKERFGKFILLEEVGASAIGSEYRAAKLSPTGLEKIVSVLRLVPAVSANAEVAKSLMDQAKIAAQLQNPNIIKIFGIGKVDASYYISYEFIEGKSLKSVFARCRQDGFPFSVDHALLITSKICSALEYAHSRRTEGGARYFHGLLDPSCVLVSYEGEVRVRGFGYWPGRIQEIGLAADQQAYLAPEQAASGSADTRADIFFMGAILFEALTGHPLFEGERTDDVAGRLAAARLQSPPGDDDALPRPIAEILQRALPVDPSARYAEVQEMRKAVDTLLFSGDFTPTTFNLAFFMHSLFREDIDRESKALKDEQDASYLEYLTEEPAKAPQRPAAGAPTAAFTVPNLTPVPVSVLPPAPVAAPHLPPPRLEGPPARAAAAEEAPSHAAPPEAALAELPAPVFTAPRRSRGPLVAVIAVVVVVAGVGGYFALGRGGSALPSSQPAPTTLSPELLRAQQRVSQLEEELRANRAKIEEEKAAAEQKAKDDTAARMRREAQAKGQNVDPAALEKAQKEAVDKARIDQEKKAQEERKRLEDEKKAAEAKAAEEARLEEQRRATEAAAAPTTTLAPPTTTAPAVRPGMLVNLSDAGVIEPVVAETPRVSYPPIALRQRVEGTVVVNALVDERGNVTDAQVVTEAGGRTGLNEAAVEAARKYRFRPATKDGVPVKVWYRVKVKFELPR